MESEFIAVSHSCRKLFPIVDTGKDISGLVGLPIGDTTVTVSVQEDNPGTLVLGDTLPLKFTPCRKYYVCNTIWF